MRKSVNWRFIGDARSSSVPRMRVEVKKKNGRKDSPLGNLSPFSEILDEEIYRAANRRWRYTRAGGNLVAGNFA